MAHPKRRIVIVKVVLLKAATCDISLIATKVPAKKIHFLIETIQSMTARIIEIICLTKQPYDFAFVQS